MKLKVRSGRRGHKGHESLFVVLPRTCLPNEGDKRAGSG